MVMTIITEVPRGLSPSTEKTLYLYLFSMCFHKIPCKNPIFLPAVKAFMKTLEKSYICACF